MNPSSDDIRTLLENESSLGLTFKTNLFVGRQPDGTNAPDDCVTVADTPAGPAHLGVNVSEYYYPTVQVVVRDNDYVDAMNLAQNIMETLHGRGNETINGTYYTLIRCSSGPTPLAWDDNERINVVVNFELQRRN
jgi:hypothetical protein